MDPNQQPVQNNLTANSNKKILIIEDDQLLREFYHELLVSEGFQVDIAEDGDIGLNKITQGGYNLVLLDIMLPKKDGVQILKILRQHPPRQPNGAIVCLTNLGQDAIIKQCFEMGAVGYLIKSALNPDQVVKEIHNYLKRT